MASTIPYLRLYSDSAGESHFESTVVGVLPKNFAPPAPSFNVSEFVPASRCGFLHVPVGWYGDLHPSPLRMWVFVLSGEMEFEATDGQRHRVVAGSAMLLEDTTGKGHLSRVIGDNPAVLAVVHV